MSFNSEGVRLADEPEYVEELRKEVEARDTQILGDDAKSPHISDLSSEDLKPVSDDDPASHKKLGKAAIVYPPKTLG